MLADEHVKITRLDRGDRFARNRLPLPAHLCLLVLIGIALLAAPAYPQTEGDEEKQPVPSGEEAAKPDKEKTPAGDQKARGILLKAAAAQGGEEIQTRMRNFHAHFALEVHDPDKGQINLEVERILDMRGESGKLWTLKRHSGSDAPFTATVFNSEDSWRIGDEGKVTVFTDRPSVFETDIKNIEDDTLLTAQLFRFFFLGAFSSEVHALRYRGEKDVDGTPCHILDGMIKAWLGGEGQTAVHLIMAVDKKSDLVRKVTIYDLGGNGGRRSFRFSRYIENPQGVLIPGNIKIYGHDESHHEMQIALQVDFVDRKTKDGKKSRKAVPRIEFNVKIPPRYFELPQEDVVPLPRGPWKSLPKLEG